jgi:hypothetical protein
METKMPYELVTAAAYHLGVTMSVQDVAKLARAVPSHVPWTEEGAEFVTGMVLGWSVAKGESV